MHTYWIYTKNIRPENIRCPNLLNRNFHADISMTKVVMDITHFYYHKKPYISFVILTCK